MEGDLVIEDESMRTFLLGVEDDKRATEIGLSILSEVRDVQVGATIRIRLFQRTGLPIYTSLASFLGKGTRLLKPIGDFFFVEENCFSEDPELPAEVEGLNALQQALAQMSDAATVVDKEKGSLFFADSAGLVELPIDISRDDLTTVTPESAAAFVNFCTDTLHRKHRLEAVAKIVIRHARGVGANDRLRNILRNLDSVLSDVKVQHAVFLSAFSYEKVRDEVEALKVEYTSRIHKVLSDIQGQLLGIPVATVVVATQMKKTGVVGTVFVANSAVLAGAFIFGLFLILLLRNQGDTLDVIKTEVNRQRLQLKSELNEAADRFDEPFNLLETRIRHQGMILCAVVIGVCVGLLLSCVAYWLLSSVAIKALMHEGVLNFV